jgi:hypothetical protein
MNDTDEFRDSKVDKSEMKLGLKLTIWWHRFCAAIYGLMTIILVGLLGKAQHIAYTFSSAQ